MHEIKCFVFSGMRLQISHIGESHIILQFGAAVSLNPLIDLVSHIMRLRVSIFVTFSIVFQSIYVKEFFV